MSNRGKSGSPPAFCRLAELGGASSAATCSADIEAVTTALLSASLPFTDTLLTEATAFKMLLGCGATEKTHQDLRSIEIYIYLSVLYMSIIPLFYHVKLVGDHIYNVYILHICRYIFCASNNL